MSRIIDESGRYNPEVPAAEAAPPQVKASSLPQNRPDPYANVNTQDFSTANTLSRQQAMKMADIAATQGLPGVAMQWKQIAAERQVSDEKANVAATMRSMLKPKHVGTLGQILEPMEQPWHGDPDYLKLADEYRRAQAKADGTSGLAPNKLALQGAAVSAREALREREATIKAEMAESGAFTEQDQRTLDAQASLAEKAALVAKQVRG